MNGRSQAEVGALVDQRRKHRGMSEAQLRDVADVDRKTLRALLDGTRWPQEETRMRVEAALGWVAGSIQDLRDGREAVGLPDKEGKQTQEPPLRLVSDDELLAEIRRRMKGERHELEDAPQSDASPEGDEGQEVRSPHDAEVTGPVADARAAAIAAELKLDSGDDHRQESG